jgi:hypothetical protein
MANTSSLFSLTKLPTVPSLSLTFFAIISSLSEPISSSPRRVGRPLRLKNSYTANAFQRGTLGIV